MATTYPQPKLALRVGVTGHRDLNPEVSIDISNRIREALQMIKTALNATSAELRACYDGGPIVSRAISPLAEGADRIFAAEALATEYELFCLLPLHREEYCKDFSGEASQKEFEALLRRAAGVLELDGVRRSEPNAYESMGRVLLDHSDMLIAVYDESHVRSNGGTADIVDIARQRQIPIIWIHPTQVPDRIINTAANPDTQILTPQLVAQVVQDLIQPPWFREKAETSAVDREDITGSYLSSKMREKSLLGGFWNIFIKVMVLGTSVPKPPEQRSFPEFAVDSLIVHRDFIDEVANRLAGLYRGAFLANYTLGVAAVFFAILSYASSTHYRAWLIGELVAIAAILLIVYVLRKRRWHNRMVDCRYLAERLRIACYLHPLAVVVPKPHPAAYHPHHNLRSSWMDWRLNAILRETHLPKGRIAAPYINHCLEYIEYWLIDQESYHNRNAIKMHRNEDALLNIGWLLVIVAFVACVLHFFIHDVRIVPWLTLCAAGFPAAAGACHAISNQGEFRKLADRSNAMALSLKGIKEELQAMSGESQLDKATLEEKALEVSEIMIEEVTDWQILYRKPPISPA
ncbi:MAG: DUF1273 family protein [Acidobacteria bacterium]|nr:DUF1273 family protein [Acidobacteriota bacterium]